MGGPAPTQVPWADTGKHPVVPVAKIVEVRLVQAGSGTPIAGVLLQATGPDGTTATDTTNSDGVAGFDVQIPARVESLPPKGGPASNSPTAVNSFATKPRPADATSPPQTTQRFIHLIRKVELATNRTPTEVLGGIRALAGYDDELWQALLGLPEQLHIPFKIGVDWGKPSNDVRHVVVARPHAPTKGETLQNVADANGLTVESLGLFNWNTTDLKRIDLCLGALVGCRSTDQGGSYLLDPRDTGRVLVPEPWVEENLPAGRKQFEFHACVPPAKALLTADETTELRLGYLAHRTDDEITKEEDEATRTALLKHSRTTPGAVECGIGEDKTTGRWVAFGHVITGIAAGIVRNKSVNLTIEKFLGGIPLPPVIILSHIIASNVDNLYAATLGGDLGQEACFHMRDFPDEAVRKTKPYIGDKTEATHAEVVGDIDGFLLGEMLDGGQRWIKQSNITRRFPGSMRLSELLERYYSDRVEMQFPVPAAKRFQEARNAAVLPPDDLKSEVRSFAQNYIYKAVGIGAGLKTFPVDDADRATAEFLAWLKIQ